LAGLPLNEALTRVEEHLAVCPECREELLALKKILQANG
jgi:predicted anti-sigma-YlaC factor YlaD